MKHCLIIFFSMLCICSLTAENVILKDVLWDDGKALELHWDLPFMPDSLSLSISDPEGNLIPAQIELGQTGMLQISDLNPDFEYSATLTAYKDEQP
ncbi:MAG TPA: hypothetical protein PKL34_01855, partial [Candidatus Cloacimonadota bacterium]|nr:hypothetical protein [Candidatus Cloacimonadota bacterium]